MPKVIILKNLSNNPVAEAIANIFCISSLSTVSRAFYQNRHESTRKAENYLSDGAN